MSGVVTAVIQSVNGDAQWDGSFGEDGQYGATYVFAWPCTVEVGGAVMDVKVRAGSKKPDELPSVAKCIVPGATIISNKKGLNEFHGQYDIYVNGSATKDANQGGGSGGGFKMTPPAPQQPRPAPQPAKAAGSAATQPATGAGYTFADLKAILQECKEAAADVMGDVGDSALGNVVASLFDAAVTQGVGAGQVSDTTPQPSPGIVLPDEVLDAIKATGLDTEGVSNENIMGLWQAAAQNPVQFGIALSSMVSVGGNVVKQGEDDDNLPF